MHLPSNVTPLSAKAEIIGLISKNQGIGFVFALLPLFTSYLNTFRSTTYTVASLVATTVAARGESYNKANSPKTAAFFVI